MKGICVESGFRFYAVVSGLLKPQKTMKNPLFRAYYEETAGIAQGRLCGTHFAVKSDYYSCVDILVLNKGGCFYGKGKYCRA